MTSVPRTPADSSPAGASAAAGTAAAGAASAGQASIDSTAGPDSRSPSLLQQVEALWRELPGLFNDRVELFALELQRAAQVATRMAGLLAVAALLSITAWALLWALLVSALVRFGFPLWAALAIALAVSLAGAVVAAGMARPLVNKLGMPVTRRHLTFSPKLDGSPPPRERTAPSHSLASDHDNDHVRPSHASAG